MTWTEFLSRLEDLCRQRNEVTLSGDYLELRVLNKVTDLLAYRKKKGEVDIFVSKLEEWDGRISSRDISCWWSEHMRGGFEDQIVELLLVSVQALTRSKDYIESRGNIGIDGMVGLNTWVKEQYVLTQFEVEDPTETLLKVRTLLKQNRPMFIYGLYVVVQFVFNYKLDIEKLLKHKLDYEQYGSDSEEGRSCISQNFRRED